MEPVPPYQGPPGLAQPPSAPRTFGLLSIIFGSLAAVSAAVNLAGGSTMAMAFLRNTPHGNRMMEAMQTFLREIHTAAVIQSGVMLLMSVALIAIGVGQRGYKKWAVRASVVWGIVALVVLVGIFLNQLLVVSPAFDRYMQAIASDTGVQMGGGLMWAGAIGTLVFYSPYPILLIATFRKPNIVAAMTH